MATSLGYQTIVSHFGNALGAISYTLVTIATKLVEDLYVPRCHNWADWVWNQDDTILTAGQYFATVSIYVCKKA